MYGNFRAVARPQSVIDGGTPLLKFINVVLTDALERILRWVDRYKPHYRNFLQPGLTQAEIEDLAAGLPFKLPPELCQLYQWQNGATAGDLGQETAWLFGNWTFVLLGDAIAEYQRSRDKAHGFPGLCDLTLSPFKLGHFVEWAAPTS